MRSLIVTGGVGCGKSRFLSLLLGILDSASKGFSSDEFVRDLLHQDEVLNVYRSILGEDVLETSETGSVLNKRLVRERLFRLPEVRRQIESYLHPLVLEGLESARSEAQVAQKELFLAEVPLHYEIESVVRADQVIVVASDRAIQAKRLMELRHLDEVLVGQILNSQMPIEAKVNRADWVIWNDGDLSVLEAQVLLLVKMLRLE